jgi:hypothetical protein
MTVLSLLRGADQFAYRGNLVQQLVTVAHAPFTDGWRVNNIERTVAHGLKHLAGMPAH